MVYGSDALFMLAEVTFIIKAERAKESEVQNW